MLGNVEVQIVCGKSPSVFGEEAVYSLTGRVNGYRPKQRYERPHESGRGDV